MTREKPLSSDRLRDKRAQRSRPLVTLTAADIPDSVGLKRTRDSRRSKVDRTKSDALPTTSAVNPGFGSPSRICDVTAATETEALAWETTYPLDFSTVSDLCTTPEELLGHSDRDNSLYQHFVNEISCLIFPLLQARTGNARCTTDDILGFFFADQASRHHCLAASALHIAATCNRQGSEISVDVSHHIDAAIVQLQAEILSGQDLSSLLNAILVSIVLQTLVDWPAECALPWHVHFHAAATLLQYLDRPLLLAAALTCWIDILGATMRAQSPIFMHVYRECREKGCDSGLAEIMGCQDQVMYLIAEIADLEATTGWLYEEERERRIIHLDTELEKMRPRILGELTCATPDTYDAQRLHEAVTAAFHIAARIYLRSLVPAFVRTDEAASLVASFTDIVVCHIPSGPTGFDRSIAWPLLLAGSISQPESSFRKMYAERTKQFHKSSNCGAVRKLQELLEATWEVSDDALHRGVAPSTTWRAEALRKGWDLLVI